MALALPTDILHQSEACRAIEDLSVWWWKWSKQLKPGVARMFRVTERSWGSRSP